MYAANVNVSLDTTNMGTREQLWKIEKGVTSYSAINDPLPWYPETCGYCVSKISYRKLYDVVWTPQVLFILCTSHHRLALLYVLIIESKTLLNYTEEGGFIVHEDKSKCFMFTCMYVGQIIVIWERSKVNAILSWLCKHLM